MTSQKVKSAPSPLKGEGGGEGDTTPFHALTFPLPPGEGKTDFFYETIKIDF